MDTNQKFSFYTNHANVTQAFSFNKKQHIKTHTRSAP